MNANLLGTIQLTHEILPYLTDDVRIINISSLLGALKFHPEQTIKKYSNPDITLEEIIDGANKFVIGVEKKNLDDWFIDEYGTSKMLLNAWSRFILQ